MPSLPHPFSPKSLLKHVSPVLLCAMLAAALLWPEIVVLPPYLLLGALFRAALPTAANPRGLPHPPLVYLIILTPVALGLLIVLYRVVTRRLLRRGMYLTRAAKALGLLILAMYVLNARVQGGLGIPLSLLYCAGLLGLCWEAQTTRWARRLLESSVWAGLGFLAASGIIAACTAGETRFDTQRMHGLYGFLWMAAAGAYLIAHIAYYESKRETSSRTCGYLATAALTAAAMTGVGRLHSGGETAASGLWPHVVTGAVAFVASAVHAGQSWRKRGLAVRLGPGSASARLVLGWVCFGMLLPTMSLALRGLAPRTPAPFASRVDVLRASPSADPTASGPNGEVLPLQQIGVRDATVGCGKTGGCHVDVQAQWEDSAHRFSANAAYRATVAVLVRESGVERARLCAGCHDPVPLLTGQIVEGSNYPFEYSEGVTCVVCHSAQPGAQHGNGHYTVAPSSTFFAGVKDRFTAYMMVKLYRDQHGRDFLGKPISDNSLCMSCHNLTLGHLVLRRTYDEWQEGPFGPKQSNRKLCTGCHMPEVGESYLGGFKLHDHRTPAANIALGKLRGESPETERAFIAEALDLQMSIEPDAEEIHLYLTNRGGGHVFPTAPRDLVDYWFEVRFEGDDESSAWSRLDDLGLFPEELVSKDGDVLVRHEIWRAADKRGPEGIEPGETREYSYPVATTRPDATGVAVRLMYRRYQDAYLSSLGPIAEQLFTAPVEVLRRTAAYAPPRRMARSVDE